jgi:hypothetical protein
MTEPTYGVPQERFPGYKVSPPMNTQEPRWLVRETTKHGFSERKGMPDHKVTVELVWGHEEKQTAKDVEQVVIVGKTYHTLKGPTAFKSITEMAERMNRDAEKPPEGKPPKTRADGYEQTFEQGGGDALFGAGELKAAISYKKGKK